MLGLLAHRLLAHRLDFPPIMYRLIRSRTLSILGMFTVNRKFSVNHCQLTELKPAIWRLVRKLSYKCNKIDSNSLDITGEIVIPPMKQSVNYITQLKLKHKLQDNNDIKTVVKLSKGA